MWFTPSVGVTSTNCVLLNLLQNHSLICALSCRSFQSSKSVHTAAGPCAHSCRSFLNLPYKNPLRTQLQRSSTHTAAEVVHAHSWDLSFPYKTNLTCLIFPYIKKPNLSILHKRLFILRSFTKPWS